MNNSKKFWQGTFKIWQNRNFGEIYAKFSNRKLYFIDEIQLFASNRPIIGNTTLYLYCAPPEEEWITKLKSLAKNLNVGKIWIYSIEQLPGLGNFFKENLFTFVINLNLPEQKLWENMGNNARKVRKANKSGVEVKVANKEGEFNKWWHIYINTAKIKGFGTQQFDLVRALFRNKNLSRLFISIVSGKIISGTLFLINDYPMFWLGGFDRNYKNYYPNNVVFWKAILYFKEKGYELLDLGGAVLDGENGTTRFKKSFRGEIKKGYIYEIPVNKLKKCLLEFISRIKIIKRY